MSWIRSLDDDFDREVTFYYSVARDADALYVDEIQRPQGASNLLGVGQVAGRAVNSGRPKNRLRQMTAR